MPTAQQLIDTIESSGLLPYSTIESLRGRADRDDLSAEDLVKLLVDSQLLTSAEAVWLLDSPADLRPDAAEQDFRAALDDLAGDPTRPPGESSVGSASGMLRGVGGTARPSDAATPAPAAAPTKPRVKETTESILEAEAGPPPVVVRGGKRRKHLKKSAGNEWESPLFLLGAGALVLLALGGIALAYLVNRGSGDEVLRTADEAYEAGSLSQAITEYARFVEDFPYHERVGLARVRLASARVRQAVETSRDPDRGLTLVEEGIAATEDDPAFAEAHGELASLLPKIARGLAAKADEVSQGDDHPTASQWVAKSVRALELCENTKYVPKSLRDDAEVAAIREELDRVERRREARAELDKTLAAMTEATAAGDPRKAYLAEAELVLRRPELAGDKALLEAVARATAAEQVTIRFRAEEVAADTAERSSPVEAQIALARPRRVGVTTLAGQHYVSYGGVAYGLSAADGTLLWRRPVGLGPAAVEPVGAGDNALVIDQRTDELLCLEGATGKLRWRAPLGGDAFAPAIVGGRAFLALANGSLLVLDVATGSRLGAVEFAQPLRSTPAVEAQRKRLYVVGEHSCLYTLDAHSLACEAVTFTGHAPGAVPATPTLVGGRLVIVENLGLQSSRVRLFTLTQAGDVDSELTSMRLGGACSTPVVASGRRFAVGADTGELALWELNPEEDGEPVLTLATRPSLRGELSPHYLAETTEGLWVASEGLTRSVASLADSRLVVQVIADPFPGDLFVAPIVARGDLVLHARSRRGGAGITVGATERTSGRAIWETDIAAAPAGPPRIAASPRGIYVPTADGLTHFVGRDEIQRGVADRPLGGVAPPPGVAASEVLDGTIDRVTPLATGETLLARAGDEAFVATSMLADAPPARGRLPGRLATGPEEMAQGWLAPLELGQVLLLSAQGEPLATPFQPPLTPGRKVLWRPAGVGQVNEQAVAVLSDDVDSVYCVGLRGGESPALVELGSQRLDGLRPATRAAIVDDRAVIGLSQDHVGVFALPSVKNPALVRLPGRIEWGPYPVGELAVLVLSTGEVVAIAVDDEPRVAWRTPLGAGPAVGEPALVGGDVCVATRSGLVRRFAAADGAAVEPIDVGQPLATGPVPYGPRLLAVSHDGSLLVIRLP